jgi:diguanylate cyclase (GGDEF)-like protein/PAS domain S-box-containing protein
MVRFFERLADRFARRFMGLGKRMPSQIGGWIVLGILGVAALMVVTTLINLRSSRSEEIDHVREAADNLANGLSVEVAAEMRLVDNSLSTITARYAAGKDALSREAALATALREQTPLLPFADALRVADAQGHVSIGLSSDEDPFSIADRPYFRQAREGGGTVVSEPIFSRAFKDWCVIVARPLRADDGEFRGVVYAVLASSHFHELFGKLAMGEDGSIALRSEEMRLVARFAASAPSTSVGLGSSDVSAQLERQLAMDREKGAYITETPLDGIERLFAYRHVPGYPLTVFVGLSTRTYLAHWRADERRQWFFTAAVILMVASGFAYVLLQHRRLLASSVYATRLAREQSLVLDNDLVGIIRVQDRRIVWANRAVNRILGYDTVVGESTRILYPDEATFEMVGRMGYQALALDGRFRAQLKLRRRDGTDIWVDLSGAALSAAESVWMIGDIDQLKHSEERAQYMALHDPLTGLANRRLFEELLRQALAQARRHGGGLGVCYMDLDGFKPINDTHGHEAGDVVLREIGARLRRELRSNDSVARLGGDEFAWLLSDVRTEADAVTALERCLHAVSQPVALEDGTTVTVGASIGLVLSNEHRQEFEELLSEADEAMYAAKRGGRGRIESRVVDGPVDTEVDR